MLPFESSNLQNYSKVTNITISKFNYENIFENNVFPQFQPTKKFVNNSENHSIWSIESPLGKSSRQCHHSKVLTYKIIRK